MVNNFAKIFLVAVLVAGSFAVAGSVFAAATITSVKVNGADSASVQPGAPITATINVSLTGQSVWKSTAYQFGDGNWICIDTPDHLGDTAVAETFPIIAPTKAGTNNVNFEIFENNDCTDGLDVATASASLLTVITKVFSLSVNKIILLLIIIIAAVVIFYLVKKIINKKINSNTNATK